MLHLPLQRAPLLHFSRAVESRVVHATTHTVRCEANRRPSSGRCIYQRVHSNACFLLSHMDVPWSLGPTAPHSADVHGSGEPGDWGGRPC